MSGKFVHVINKLGHVFCHGCTANTLAYSYLNAGRFAHERAENQLSAAVGTIAIILAFLGIGFLGSLVPSSYAIRYVLDALSIFTRFQTFVNGYFDLASIVYYLSCTAVFLWLTVRVYDRRRFS